MNATERFSNRVENYVKYRPGYPSAILDFLRIELGFTSAAAVADLGSGTGLLTKLFLQNGNSVFGIEPNAEMRAAGEDLLREFSRFTSIDGTAEATTLSDDSVDAVVAGQAFHWFDVGPTRREIARILRPGGAVFLIWNSRRLVGSPFMEEYEAILLEFADNYTGVSERNVDDATIARFYAPKGFQVKTFDNAQIFDQQSLIGRALSSSYMPLPGHPQHEIMIEKLRQLFDDYQQEGVVQFLYLTRLYYGEL